MHLFPQNQPVKLVLALSLSWLLTACGGIVSSPGNGASGGSALDANPPGQAQVAVAAAAPTLEGILSAPADDDNVTTLIELLTHFDVFLAPNYEMSLKGSTSYLGPKDLKFLVKVGLATRVECNVPESQQPNCWKWYDTNLLAGVMVRAYVYTTAFVPNPGGAEAGLLESKWYFRDYLLTKVLEDGSNLSLLDLNPKQGDEINLVLFEKKPDDYAPQGSPLFGGYATQVSGGGNHSLAAIKIEPLILMP